MEKKCLILYQNNKGGITDTFLHMIYTYIYHKKMEFDEVIHHFNKYNDIYKKYFDFAGKNIDITKIKKDNIYVISKESKVFDKNIPDNKYIKSSFEHLIVFKQFKYMKARLMYTDNFLCDEIIHLYTKHLIPTDYFKKQIDSWCKRLSIDKTITIGIHIRTHDQQMIGKKSKEFNDKLYDDVKTFMIKCKKTIEDNNKEYNVFICTNDSKMNIYDISAEIFTKKCKYIKPSGKFFHQNYMKHTFIPTYESEKAFLDHYILSMKCKNIFGSNIKSGFYKYAKIIGSGV